VTERERLLTFLTDDDFDEPLFIPLADGNYAATVVGKDLVTETDLADQLHAARVTGYSPIVFPGIDPAETDPELGYRKVSETRAGDKIRRDYTLETPEGPLTRAHVEQPHLGVSDIEMPVKDEQDLPALRWVAQRICSGPCEEGVRRQCRAAREQVGEEALTVVQVGQAFELMNSILLHDIPVLYLTAQDAYMETVAAVAEAQKRLARLMPKPGIDLIWMSTPGTELFSPSMMTDAVVPCARKMADHVHRCGGLVYFHSCGKNREFIGRGFYNQIRPDLFETLAGPPTGDIEDIGRARRQIAPEIRTKGNLDGGLMFRGSVEEVVTAARNILERTRGTRHALGLSDAVLFGTPPDTMRAVSDLVREFH